MKGYLWMAIQVAVCISAIARNLFIEHNGTEGDREDDSIWFEDANSMFDIFRR